MTEGWWSGIFKGAFPAHSNRAKVGESLWVNSFLVDPLRGPGFMKGILWSDLWPFCGLQALSLSPHEKTINPGSRPLEIRAPALTYVFVFKFSADFWSAENSLFFFFLFFFFYHLSCAFKKCFSFSRFLVFNTQPSMLGSALRRRECCIQSTLLLETEVCNNFTVSRNTKTSLKRLSLTSFRWESRPRKVKSLA